MNRCAPTLLRAIAPCLLALGAMDCARAGAPLQTEDADILKARDCEIEVSLLHLSKPAHAGSTGGTLQCGAVERLQLGAAFERAHEDGTHTRSGQLSGKLHLAGTDEGPRWALGAVLGADEDDGGHWRAARTRVSLLTSLPAGPGTVHLNLGRYRDIPSQLLATTWGLAYEYQPVAVGGIGWAPMVEAFGTRALGSTFNLGLRGTLVPERLFLNLSLGRQSRAPHATITTVGLRWAL